MDKGKVLLFLIIATIALITLFVSPLIFIAFMLLILVLRATIFNN